MTVEEFRTKLENHIATCDQAIMAIKAKLRHSSYGTPMISENDLTPLKELKRLKQKRKDLLALHKTLLEEMEE